MKSATSYRPNGVRQIVSDVPIAKNGVPACNWYALRTAPGREVAGIDALARSDIYAFCPMEERTWFVNGRKQSRKYPTVSQLIYARFRHYPRWDVMKERRIISGVYTVGNRPIVLPKDAIRMLQGLPIKAERIARAKEEMNRIHPGDTVTLLDGPMASLAVDVTRSTLNRVWWEGVLSNGIPVSGVMDRNDVEKR